MFACFSVQTYTSCHLQRVVIFHPKNYRTNQTTSKNQEKINGLLRIINTHGRQTTPGTYYKNYIIVRHVYCPSPGDEQIDHIYMLRRIKVDRFQKIQKSDDHYTKHPRCPVPHLDQKGSCNSKQEASYSSIVCSASS